MNDKFVSLESAQAHLFIQYLTFPWWPHSSDFDMIPLMNDTAHRDLDFSLTLRCHVVYDDPDLNTTVVLLNEPTCNPFW